MFFIQSQRLKLLPLTHSQLQLCAQSRSQMEIAIGLTPSTMQIAPLYQAELDDAMQNFWLPNTQQHPEQYYWYTNWEMILLSQNRSIGGIGFVGTPNEQGEAMVGYMVDAAFHRQCFASEALQRMADWYFEQPNAITLLASTGEDNVASAKTLERCGFQFERAADGLLHYRKG